MIMNLPAIQSDQQAIGLLELDQAPKIASLLGLDLTSPANEDTIKDFIQDMGTIGAQYATGLVIDPIYSFSLADESQEAGLLTRVTTLHEEIDPLSLPTLMPNYGLDEIRQNYSLAKLELYYHPQEEKALAKKRLVAEVFDYCDYLDIEMLLKLIVYTPSGEEFDQTTFQQDQLQAIQEMRSITNALALQYPLDPLSTATVTAELDIPWVLMSQDQPYQEYKQSLRTSLENGAVGFMTGDSLWRDLQELKAKDKSPDLEKVQQFVNTTYQDRVIELMRISDEVVGQE